MSRSRHDTIDMPKTKKRGEAWSVVFVEGLPQNTLHEFRTEVMNKPNEHDRVTESTADKYETNIRLFLDWVSETRRTESALSVDTGDLRRYLKHRRQTGDSDHTLMGRRTAVSRFYDELQVLADDGVLPIEPSDVPENPENGYDASWAVSETRKAKNSGEGVTYLSATEVKELWQNVPSPKLRNRLIIRLAYQTGMRVGELVQIRLSNIGFAWEGQSREVIIPASTSKGGSRVVAYKPTLDSDLRRWVQGGLRDSVRGSDDSPYLFPTRNGDHITTQWVSEIVREAADAADMNESVYTDNAGNTRSKVSPHILRHSFAVNVLKADTLNVRELQSFLGHSDLETTEKYLKEASDDATDKYRERGGPPEA